MVESVAPIASRILRSGDAAGAASVLELLGAIGSTRLAPTIGVGLEHADAGVRTAAMVALAESGGAESMQLLVRALEHRDPETRRVAAREIGRTGSAEGLPALLRVLGGGRPFDRDWKLKQEVLRSIEMLHSPQAVPAVRRLARQQVVFGKKNRELRVLARRVLESLE
jgi:HEAT repeat protein